jgi:hypothetical protein
VTFFAESPMTHDITEEAFRGPKETLRATFSGRVLALFYMSLRSFDFACYLRATCVLPACYLVNKGLSRR